MLLLFDYYYYHDDNRYNSMMMIIRNHCLNLEIVIITIYKKNFQVFLLFFLLNTWIFWAKTLTFSKNAWIIMFILSCRNKNKTKQKWKTRRIKDLIFFFLKLTRDYFFFHNHCPVLQTRTHTSRISGTLNFFFFIFGHKDFRRLRFRQ